MKELSPEQRENRRRILEISHEAKASHLGSCLSVVDIIYAIYQVKKTNEKFVLSGGHAAVAWYVVLEKYGFLKNPNLANLHVHPDRNPQIGIEVSTGSLGQGLPIALGMALADREKKVYCVITDGETNEGSVWETLRIAADKRVDNLKLVCNANGWGAYDPIDVEGLIHKFKAFGWEILPVDGHNIEKLKEGLRVWIKGIPILVFARTTVEQFQFLKGQDAHYKVMTDEDFKQAMEELKKEK